MRPLLRFFVVVIAVCALTGLGQPAPTADERFIAAYHDIRSADALRDTQRTDAARDRYTAAKAALETLKNDYPSWNPGVIQFRLNYIAEQLAKLDQAPAAPSPPQPATVPGDGAGPRPAADPAQQIRQLIAERDLLQAQLREALAARPAAIDPLELARAEERLENQEIIIRQLRLQLEQLEPGASRPKETAPAPQPIETAATTVRDQSAAVSALETALQTAQRETAALAAQKRELERQLAERRLPSGRVVETDLGGAPGQPGATALERQVQDLQARLAALEAPRVPYTAEELALFQVPPIQPRRTNEVAPPGVVFPQAVTDLLGQAERDFRERRFDEAERKYLAAAKQTDNPPSILAEVAAAQLEQQQFDKAQATLAAIFAVEPESAHALFLLGRLRFHQGRADQALPLLSRSAQMDGGRPEVFNFLGIVLGELGLMDGAETALRRSIQMAPGYANAHYNLAIVYATRRPPSVELARWHYDRAKAAGHPPSAEVEQMLQAFAPSLPVP